MFARLWSLLRLLFIWKKDLSLDLPEVSEDPPNCIIMLAFGQAYEPISLRAGLETSRLVPGEPNEAIARLMGCPNRNATYGEELPLILAQWEFGETREFRLSYGRHPKAFKFLGSRGEYRNTREVLQEARAIMNEQGWTKAVIVAHPWHLARCQWTAQRLGIKVIHDRLMTGELNDFASSWNDKAEVPENQMQTTSLKHWLWYEFRARGYFWLKGWI